MDNSFKKRFWSIVKRDTALHYFLCEAKFNPKYISEQGRIVISAYKIARDAANGKPHY